jgi:hypothetical protein
MMQALLTAIYTEKYTSIAAATSLLVSRDSYRLGWGIENIIVDILRHTSPW